MNIVYTFNDLFVPQAAAAISSLCENNKEEKAITFFLITTGVKKDNKKKLRKLVTKYNRKVSIIEIDNISDYIDFEFDTSGWNPIVLFRLFLDKILPIRIEKILYLDADTIVRGKLTDLWNINLEDKTLGMSIEPTISKNRKASLELIDYPYYNAGVMLIN